MKTITLVFIAILSAVPLFASDAFEVIEKEGLLRFSDGSSIYSFRKDGAFELGPVSMSGRTITGKWRKEDDFFIIEGEWSWINGVSQPGDIRTMRLHVSPRDEKEIIGYRKESVTKVYFTIESIEKKYGSVSVASELNERDLNARKPPTLKIEDALHLAQKYYTEKEDLKKGRFIEKIHYVEINTSKPEKGPFWVITYAMPTRVIGGQIFISVYMDSTISVFRGL